jgi:Sigma-70, region 4
MAGVHTPMSRLDDLPPDQSAALSLLLRQGKSYAEVAGLLGISERAVHDRAHAALAVLAPREARELAAGRREEIGDYLLSQLPGAAARRATRTYLEGSAQGRAWAQALAAELAPLGPARLGEIPSGRGPSADVNDGGHAPPPARPLAASPPSPAARVALPSSRLGGALLLALLVAGVIVAVVLNSGGGTSGKATASTPGSTAASRTGSSTGSSTSSSTAPRATEDRRITLTSPTPGNRAIGVAEVLSEGSKYAFYLAAEHLPPSTGFFYAVWLYNSPSSYEALTRSPAVGSNGRLQGGALLPSNAGSYHTMLLTKETGSQPTHPGPTVLSGAFGLH